MAIIFVTAGAWGPGTGVPHTPAQADNNFFELRERITAIETTPPEAISIDDITIIGDQLTFLLTDATTRGPFTVPVATFIPRGEWTAATIYAKNSVVSNAGRLYWIPEAHTSAATFDPDATGVGPLYVKILDPPIQPNDYHVFIGSTMIDAQLLLFNESVRRWQLPASLTGSRARSQVAATAETIVTLKRNGVSIGTLTWAAAGTIPVASFASAVTFEIDDTFSLHGPAIADATLSDISFDLLGNRI